MKQSHDLIASPEHALQMMREVGKAVTSALDLDQALRVIMEQVARLFQPKDWSLLMVDEEANELYFAIVVGEASDKLKNLRLKIGEGVAGWVAEQKKPVHVGDVYNDERFARWFDEKSGFKTESMVCLPLISKGRTLGVIELINYPKESMTAQNLEFLEALADFAAIAIENARHVMKIKELTIIDDCSGLFNARHMHSLIDTEIAKSDRYHSSFSLVFLDLDHFKMVNDTHGHLIGSRLLHDIGQLIKHSLRTIDAAIRYGGDEFVVVLPQTGKKDALMVTNRIRDALREKKFFTEEGLNITVTASFGISTFPDDAANKEEILRQADQAMYRVKESTRDGIAVAVEKN